MELPLLSLLIWMPIIAAVMVLFAGRGSGEQMKWFVLVVSIVELVASVFLLLRALPHGNTIPR